MCIVPSITDFCKCFETDFVRLRVETVTIGEVIMKNLLAIVFLYLTFFFPYVVMADVSGEIVFAHPVKPSELWITGLNVGGETRQIYAHEPDPDFRILDVVAQKDRHFVVFLARSGDERAGIHLYNLYIINKRFSGKKAINITQDRYGLINEGDFDISRNGDVVFECTPPPGDLKYVYLIPHSEFNQPDPKGILLAENAKDPVWFPDGEKIAFVEDLNISTLEIATKKVVPLGVLGSNPTISPDSLSLAVIHSFWGITLAIDVYSLSPLKLRTRYKLSQRSTFMDFKWSPDGEEIVYTSSVGRKHYALPYDSHTNRIGREKEFLVEKIFGYQVTMFDWTHIGAYPVEPKNRLTTMWSRIKQ